MYAPGVTWGDRKSRASGDAATPGTRAFSHAAIRSTTSANRARRRGARWTEHNWS
ncbi:MAG: hypothetical protein QOK14_465 [Frankiaceae bacterium]|jgi:hypothetical protein|nr:hypothetical protein [Frankiaceae bacterium]